TSCNGVLKEFLLHCIQVCNRLIISCLLPSVHNPAPHSQASHTETPPLYCPLPPPAAGGRPPALCFFPGIGKILFQAPGNGTARGYTLPRSTRHILQLPAKMFLQ